MNGGSGHTADMVSVRPMFDCFVRTYVRRVDRLQFSPPPRCRRRARRRLTPAVLSDHNARRRPVRELFAL